MFVLRIFDGNKNVKLQPRDPRSFIQSSSRDNSEILAEADQMIDKIVTNLGSNPSDDSESVDEELCQVLTEHVFASSSFETVNSSSDASAHVEISALLTDEFVLNEQNWENALFYQKESINFDSDLQLVHITSINTTEMFSDSDSETDHEKSTDSQKETKILNSEPIIIDSDETNIDEPFDICALSSADEAQITLNPVNGQISSDSSGSLKGYQGISLDRTKFSVSEESQKPGVSDERINLDSSRSADSSDGDIPDLIDNQTIDEGMGSKQNIHRLLTTANDDHELAILKRFGLFR